MAPLRIFFMRTLQAQREEDGKYATEIFKSYPSQARFYFELVPLGTGRGGDSIPLPILTLIKIDHKSVKNSVIRVLGMNRALKSLLFKN